MTNNTKTNSTQRFLLKNNNESLIFKIPSQVLKTLNNSKQEIIDSYVKFVENSVKHKYYNPIYLDVDYSIEDEDSITVCTKIKLDNSKKILNEKIKELEQEKESIDKFLSICQTEEEGKFNNLIDKRNELKSVIKELKELA